VLLRSLVIAASLELRGRQRFPGRLELSEFPRLIWM